MGGDQTLARSALRRRVATLADAGTQKKRRLVSCVRPVLSIKTLPKISGSPGKILLAFMPDFCQTGCYLDNRPVEPPALFHHPAKQGQLPALLSAVVSHPL